VLIPIGFTLLVLQALSELIKRVAFLTGHAPDHLDRASHHHSQADQVAAGEPT
jgi:TRAP-type mannitol/chloroaromatic compound transport system permease small subunit